MRSRIVADSTASPGRTKAHNRLRAKSTTGPLLPAVANACGCSILAEANTSACVPSAISSFSIPDGPYLACTLSPDAASNASVTSVSAVRRLPAAWSKTGSDATTGTAIVVAARLTTRRESITLSGYSRWGQKQLLAVNLVIGDCLLAFVRNKPVDELLAKLLLHMRMLGRVNQDDTVLVEQQFVALHRDDEVGLVLERNPRAAVRQRIGSAGCCYVERGTHALPDRFVPRPSLLFDVDAGVLPEFDFRNMRTGVVAARDEGCTLGLNGLQRKGGVP